LGFLDINYDNLFDFLDKDIVTTVMRGKKGILEPSPGDRKNNILLKMPDVLAVLCYGCLLKPF